MGLSGTNLIFGAGQMESGAYSDPSLVVIADELVGMTRRIMRGVGVDEDRLARGVIDDVQPGGHYLGSPHTLYYFKDEQFWPQMMNRKRLDDWIAAGSKTLGERAAEKAKDLLTYAEAVPLTAEIAAKLQAIIAKAEGN
jgi:trimethylamine--corrinoid protein Co-methyltransferase